MTSPVLTAADLSIGYAAHGEVRQILADVDIELKPNQIIGLAGESGSGKSTLALSLVGYRSPGSVCVGGAVKLGNLNIGTAAPRQLRALWGGRLAYMPQDTSTSLNPALRIGSQLVEVLRQHRSMRRSAATDRAAELLDQVGVPDPVAALRRYPHQFSGGQQQRIALAIALSCEPDVLVLDEPTTGLDVTTQARVNRLIIDLVRRGGTATLYVSHNLALLATICDQLAIMYGGEIVEQGPAGEVYLSPRHPYTAALIAAVPSVRGDHRPKGIPGLPPPVVVKQRCGFADRCPHRRDICLSPVPLTAVNPQHVVRCVRSAELGPLATVSSSGMVAVRPATATAPILRASDIRCVFRSGGSETVALDDVSVEIRPGRTLGIAGESGSGKSTLLRVMAGLLQPNSGGLEFQGSALPAGVGRRSRIQRQAIQIVFQNPDATLNPRHTVMGALERPMKLFRPGLDPAARREVAIDMLHRVRLSPDILDRSPRSLSGGQRQRVALARALVAEPRVILCDEVTAALDVSVQATVLELLAELREGRDMAMVFVTHDLGVLRSIADDAMILEKGQVRETGLIADVLDRPQSDYTMELLASVPDPLAAAEFLGAST